MSEHKGNFASCSSFQNAFQAEKLMNIFNTLLNDHPVYNQKLKLKKDFKYKKFRLLLKKMELGKFEFGNFLKHKHKNL